MVPGQPQAKAPKERPPTTPCGRLSKRERTTFLNLPEPESEAIDYQRPEAHTSRKGVFGIRFAKAQVVLGWNVERSLGSDHEQLSLTIPPALDRRASLCYRLVKNRNAILWRFTNRSKT